MSRKHPNLLKSLPPLFVGQLLAGDGRKHPTQKKKNFTRFCQPNTADHLWQWQSWQSAQI